MKIFEYTSNDLYESLNKSTINLSKFDTSLLNEWLARMKIDGLFKFKLESSLPTKILDGKYRFIIQKNPKRYSEKRPSQITITSSINIPFDSSKFNFHKINPNEIIFKLNRKDENVESNDDYIIINNSPIELGHCLIVPKLTSNLNQILNSDSIKLATELIILSNCLNLIIGFNTIQAYASVNHLHLHLYYLNLTDGDLRFPFPVQSITQAERVSHNLWFLNDQISLIPGFAVQLSDFKNDVDKFVKKVFSITKYLIENDIPHNLVLVKAIEFSNTKSELLTVRCVIWPKRHASDIKSNSMSINFAMCELSGHVFLPRDEDFDVITEDYLVDIAKDVKLGNGKIESIKNDLNNF